MGIDRKDVRIVCHFNIPKSMEAFYQESGRAGRDQLPSKSVLYYGLDDRRRMEFILSNAASKKPQSSCSENNPSKKSLADFKQMVEYCEGSGCRRKKILESFGEQAPPFCQKTCDACKHPCLVSSQLEELNQVPSFYRKDGLAPVFFKSSLVALVDGMDSEFWNRDDEGSVLDEDISNSDDEADALSSLARSKISSKSGLDEKFEALQHAEEAYYQNKVQKKSGGLPDKKVISEILREASKKRLSTALNNALERLGEQLPAIDAAASFLETECFEKYEKVGKTFYNSQVAATIRWLSSSTYGQINDRLNTNLPLASTTSSEDCHSNMISSPKPLSAYCESAEPETSKERTHDSSIQPSHPCNSLQVEISKEKIELPPIPSFSEFAKKNLKAAERVQKRVMESGKHGRSDLEKKMKLR